MSIHIPAKPLLSALIPSTDYFTTERPAAPAAPLRALTALDQAYAYWGSDEAEPVAHKQN